MNMLPVLARAFGVDPVAFERQVEAGADTRSCFYEAWLKKPLPAGGGAQRGGKGDA